MGFCAVEAVGTKKESWKALFSASIISIGFKMKADESYMLAIKEYENQLTKNPDNVSVLINKAALTSYIKGKDVGEKEFQIIIKKYPKDKSAGFFAEMRKNDPAEFEKLFDRKLAALNAFE